MFYEVDICIYLAKVMTLISPIVLGQHMLDILFNFTSIEHKVLLIILKKLAIFSFDAFQIKLALFTIKSKYVQTNYKIFVIINSLINC